MYITMIKSNTADNSHVVLAGEKMPDFRRCLKPIL
jgi:hypothetical protein